MTASIGDEAAALREELARLVGEMTIIELQALLLAIEEIDRTRTRNRTKVSGVRPGGRKRRRVT